MQLLQDSFPLLPFVFVFLPGEEGGIVSTLCYETGIYHGKPSFLQKNTTEKTRVFGVAGVFGTHFLSSWKLFGKTIFVANEPFGHFFANRGHVERRTA